MHSDNQDQMHELEELRLPELQPRFAKIVREPTRTPRGQLFYRLVRLAMEPNQAPPHVASAAGGPAVDASCDGTDKVG